jgi:hypothetical protein
MHAKAAWVIALATLLAAECGAFAQIPPPPLVMTPHPNPSSSLVLPAPGEVPVSPQTPATSPGPAGAAGYGYGDHASCSVFHRGPCFPRYLPPIGQDLRLTIVSTDDDTPADQQAGSADNEHALDTIRDMFAALRGCWVPPPKDEARHGMEYTIRFAFKRDGEVVAPPRVTYASRDVPTETRNVYRDAVDAALKRCMPLHFSKGMGGAVAGRPIAIRFVDDRTIDRAKDVR